MPRCNFIISALVLCLSCTNTKTEESNANMVYVCTGPQSHCYHFDSLCIAFNRCTGERNDISLDSAVRLYDPCGFCVKREKVTGNEKPDSIIEVKKEDRKIKKIRRKKKPKIAPRNPLEEIPREY